MVYDDYESLMANLMPSLAMATRAEVLLKQSIVKFFKVEIEFEEDYRDLKMIIPKEISGTHPILSVLKDYNWVYFSEYTDGKIIIMNKKATDITYTWNWDK